MGQIYSTNVVRFWHKSLTDAFDHVTHVPSDLGTLTEALVYVTKQQLVLMS